MGKGILETTQREALSEQRLHGQDEISVLTPKASYCILKHLIAEAKGTPWGFYVEAANSLTAVNEKPLESIQ